MLQFGLPAMAEVHALIGLGEALITASGVALGTLAVFALAWALGRTATGRRAARG